MAELTPTPFVARWRGMLLSAGLDPTAVAVGIVLAEFADWATGDNARPSHATIGECLGGLSSESIRKATRRLEAARLLRAKSRPTTGRVTVWRLTDPGWNEAEEPTLHVTPHATPHATPHVSVGLPVDQGTSRPAACAPETDDEDELEGLADAIIAHSLLGAGCSWERWKRYPRRDRDRLEAQVDAALRTGTPPQVILDHLSRRSDVNVVHWPAFVASRLPAPERSAS